MPRPAVSVLCAMYAGATVLLAFGCLFPLSPTAPVGLGLALLPAGVVVTTALWVWHARVSDGLALAATALLVALMGVLLAAATTPAGVLVDVIGFGWVVAYVALLHPQWTLRCTAPAVATAVVAVAVGGVPGVWPAVVVVLASVAMVAGVLGRLSRVVRHDLSTDPLTGVLNRAGLRDAIRRTRGTRSAVAVIDLDAFKAVNDDLGHLAGDRLLADAAGAWLGVLRRDDVLARTGGDEFVVVMPDTTEAEASAVLGRLRSAHPVAFSAGIALLHDGDAEAALERADRELYRVKARRRPCRPLVTAVRPT